MSKKSKKINLLRYYKKYVPLIILLFLLLILQASCDLMLPDKMSQIVKTIADINITNKVAQIWKIGLVMLIYSLVITITAFFIGFCASKISVFGAADIRKAMFDKISHFSSSEIDKFNISSLITRTTNDITQVQTFSIMFLRIVLYAPIMAIGGIIKAMDKSTSVSNLPWVIVGAVGIVVATIIILLLIVQPRFARLQSIIDNLNGEARENLNGMMVIRAFNTTEFEEKRFDKVNHELYSNVLFLNRILSILYPVVNLVMSSINIVAVFIAAYNATDITGVADMMAFMSYATQIVMSFMMITMVFVMTPRAFVSIKRIHEVLNQPISVTNKENAIDFKATEGEIKFDNVCFSYGESEENVLSNINFTAKKGTTTAIIGSTGSGKSTLVKLIPRLYNISSGKITIDGVDINDMTLSSLRENISYVPQKNILFSGTIKSNIQYRDQGKGENSDKKMRVASSISQSAEFIENKEKMYESEISQGGGNVSGGQRQRLAIARALYSDTPIYIFDDSFSALDFKTDAKLRQSLNQHKKDSTILIVAQRVGSIMNADQILVLSDGEIVGKGTHKELLSSCPVYQSIAKSQLSMEELANE